MRKVERRDNPPSGSVTRKGHERGAMAELPEGTVTVLFIDMKGSTRFLHTLGGNAYQGTQSSALVSL